MQEINASIPFDKQLWGQDIRGSLAHVEMLAAQGIIANEEADQIANGLKQVASEFNLLRRDMRVFVADVDLYVGREVGKVPPPPPTLVGTLPQPLPPPFPPCCSP